MSEPIGLTEATRSRLAQPMKGRELTAQAIAGIPFLLAAGLLATYGDVGHVDALDVALFVLAAAITGNLEFETGFGSLVPTQLIFVPMLFVLPPAIVPLVVVAGLAFADLPDLVTGRLHPQRLVAVTGDAWFALGPALIFVLADSREPTLADWPLYLVALVSQFAGDLGSSTLRGFVAHRVRPTLQLEVLREV